MTCTTRCLVQHPSSPITHPSVMVFDHKFPELSWRLVLQYHNLVFSFLLTLDHKSHRIVLYGLSITKGPPVYTTTTRITVSEGPTHRGVWITGICVPDRLHSFNLTLHLIYNLVSTFGRGNFERWGFGLYGKISRIWDLDVLVLLIPVSRGVTVWGVSVGLWIYSHLSCQVWRRLTVFFLFLWSPFF